MAELLKKVSIQPLERPFPIPLRVSRVGLQAAEDGWTGSLDDRWHSAEAFRGNFRDEFRDGLIYYLQQKGFQVVTTPEALQVTVLFSRFEGRKRIHEDGGDLVGTLVLGFGAQEVARSDLFESLSYRDESDECPAFAKEFGLEGVKFATVLFFRLSLSFYESISESLLNTMTTLPSQTQAVSAPKPPGPAGANGGAAPPEPIRQEAQSPEKDKSMGFLTFESAPDGAEIYVDGKLVGTTPAARVQLTAGDYKVALKKKGFKEWSRDITVLEGNSLTLKAELEREKP